MQQQNPVSKHAMIKFLLAGLVFFATALPARADTIFFKNGARLDIVKAWQEDGQIKCEMYGQEVAYPLKDVLRVEKNTAPIPPADTEAAPAKQKTPASIKRELDILTLHNAAMELAGKGRMRDALDKEKQAYRLDPDNEAVRTSLGTLYNACGVEKKKQGDFDGALQQLQYASEYAPHEPQIKKNIAVVYVEIARQAMEKNDFRQGQALLDKAAEYDPLNPHIFVSSGRIAYIDNNYAKAEQDWTRALELAPHLRDVREQLQKLQKEKTLEDGFEVRERDNFSLKFESVHNRDLADALMQVLRDAYREVGRDFDLYPDSTVPVIVYPQSDLGQLEYFPDWAAGAYDGKIRFGEHLWKQNLKMKAVLYHEYTHVLVRMATGSNAPFWLNEGLAEYEARRFKAPYMIGGREKLLHSVQSFFTLSELSGLNIPSLSKMQPQAIELAYAQSESFVTWLIEKYSFRDMRSLLARLGRGENIQTAVRGEFNEELAVLEQKWREQLR
jgi:tetratricopeptide (TPR) repeat protein